MKLILLIFIVGCFQFCGKVPAENKIFEYTHGAITRGDTSEKHITLVFTGGDYGDGGEYIREVLKKNNVKGAFFFTGDFYRNPDFKQTIVNLKNDGHYLGAHSDKHLLYCSWERRDSLLVTENAFKTDLQANYREMEKYGITKEQAPYFLPPYEWYNEQIADWTEKLGLTLINHTRGTYSHADYTIPSMGKSYRSSRFIWDSIFNYEQNSKNGLNGFLLLAHIGTHAERTDKFYFYLDELIKELRKLDYRFITLDEMLR